MRPYSLTVLQGGIDRLRVKGGAAANRLYDLQNAYITNAGSIAPREGTIRAATLDTNTVGLASLNGVLNVFSNTFTTSTATVPAGYQLNVLAHPTLSTEAPVKIWFAKPFMGFLYVVPQFANGDIFHYWLQSNGVWASNTVYSTGNIVTPPTANGLAYQAVRDFPPNPTWTAETNITLGQVIEPNQYTGFAYKAVTLAGQQQGLIYHFDGTAGSTTFTDSGGYNIPAVIGTGSPSIETTQVKFGTGALSLNGSSYTTTTMTAGGAVDLESDFTIECWVYPTTLHLGTIQIPISVSSSSTTADYIWFRWDTATNADVVMFNGGTGSSFATGIVDNTWNHIAIVCKGTTGYVFVNGIQPAQSPFAFTVRPNPLVTAHLNIGARKNSGIGATNFFTGNVDEVRVTNGVALYTANFTPPSAPFAQTPYGAHTGASEPVWPTVSAGIIQEFGDFDTSVTDAGTTQTTATASGAQPLGKNITDRYGNSGTIANGGTPLSSALTLPTLASTKVTTWQAGTLYAPGAVVKPSTTQGAFINAIPNGDFEAGNDGNWTFSGTTPWAFTNTGQYQGLSCIQIPTGNMSAGGDFATMTNFGVVTPGQSVTASAYLNPNNIGANLDLWIQLNWYTSADVLISSSVGVHQEGGGYRKSSVAGIAPATAARVRVALGAGSGTNSRNTGFADLVTWSLEQPTAISNFLFEAVQANPASSGQTQPVWPTSANATIIDGGVTWDAVGTSIITWEAIPLMLSGANPPTFPTAVGNHVYDSSSFTDINGSVITSCSMSWVCISRQITDPKCPNTNAVVLGASHVFAGDKDIVDFSAAIDPTDWSSTNNAGYLPTGLNNYGDNPVAMLALYRSNLMAFNSNGYQMWQIDPDPSNMALLDAQPVGSIYPRAAQSVANDLLFLTEVGVRNLGTVGATANMQIGNTGQPIDPLVIAQLKGGNAATVFNVTCADVYKLLTTAGGYVNATLSTSSFANLLTTGGSITPANFGSIPVAGVTGNQDTTNVTDFFLYFFGNIAASALLSVQGADTAGNPYTLLGSQAAVSYNPGANITQFYWGAATTAYPFPVAGNVFITLTAPGSGSPTFDPLSLYYPGRGQYWLIFGPQAFVFTINGAQGIKSWSRYTFPDTITDWTIQNSVLYLRTAGNLVWQFDANTLVDDAGATGNNVVFNGVIQWPYLDMGSLGINKMLVGADLVGDGDVILQIAFDQADKTTFVDNPAFVDSLNVTAPYTIAIADTVPGEPLPIPINAPSYSLILTFPGGQQWTWEAANLYIQPAGGAGATG